MNDTANDVMLNVRGMHCAGCVGNVESALRSVSGVTDASVNLATERARVRLEGSLSATTEKLVEAVRQAGYEAEIASGRGSTPKAAAHEPSHPAAHEHNSAPSRLRIAAALGLPVVVGHLLVAFAPPLATRLGLHSTAWGWVQAALTLAVLLLAAGRMLRGALAAARRLRGDMDLLVSLGAVTAFVAGVVGVVLHIHELQLFDTTVMIVLLVALGKKLETSARGRALAALHGLAERVPDRAVRLTPGGGAEEIDIGNVAVGDVLRVAAEQRVPVDGTVTAGGGSADESLLTGESRPIEKRGGDGVVGGSLLIEGLIELRATATGEDSAAARIERMVADAQATKSRWQRLADSVAAVFVPVVLGLALLTLIGWWISGAGIATALVRAVAVLVVACPCAMGLAIPTAVLVGSTRAAERGILIRDVEAIEAAASVRRVLLDKTGTLTLGRPRVTGVRVAAGFEEGAVLRLAGGLALLSPHPLLRAIGRASERGENVTTAAALGRGLTVLNARADGAGDVREFVSAAGRGVRAVVDGKRVAAGSEAWLRELGIAVDDGLMGGAKSGEEDTADTAVARGAPSGQSENAAEQWQQAKTQPRAAVPHGSRVLIAIDGRHAATVLLRDEVHADARAAVAALRELDVAVELVSGDREGEVRRVAGELGIATWHAGVTPEGKLAIVRAASEGEAKQSFALRGEVAALGGESARSDGSREESARSAVAMVGDGVNDAPALAAAALGVAMGAGAETARQAAAVCIVSGSPLRIAELLRVARATVRVMKQNLGWAAGYNLAMLPLAALTPVRAEWMAAAMMLSSLTVVGNSLRLRRSA